jgi:hypothetical protein
MRGQYMIMDAETSKAVTPLLHKQAPGLVHGMLAASLAVTPCKILIPVLQISINWFSCCYVKASRRCSS